MELGKERNFKVRAILTRVSYMRRIPKAIPTFPLLTHRFKRRYYCYVIRKDGNDLSPMLLTRLNVKTANMLHRSVWHRVSKLLGDRASTT